MTLIEAGDIFDRWKVSPPAHWMMQTLAGAWGWKGPGKKGRAETPDGPAPDAAGAAATVGALAAVPGNQAAQSIYDGFAQQGANPGRSMMHQRFLDALAEVEKRKGGRARG